MGMTIEEFEEYAKSHNILTMTKEFYEHRLKADKAAMLTEIQLEIEEKEQYYQDKFLKAKSAVHATAMGGRMFGCGECKEIIQEKINALRGNTDGKDNDRH